MEYPIYEKNECPNHPDYILNAQAVGWEVWAYSEYGRNGFPRIAELRRIKKV